MPLTLASSVRAQIWTSIELVLLATTEPMAVCDRSRHDLVSYEQRKIASAIGDSNGHEHLPNLSNRLPLSQEPLRHLQPL